MKTHYRASAITAPIIGVWVILLLTLGPATTAKAQPARDTSGQVLTRGPIHEAFAEAPNLSPTAGALITRSPRFPITELPPDQRPEGNNVAWIPGYWGWDDSRDDFIWISGVWRDIPPGRQWVPGYWGTVEGGSRWVSGFWGDVAQTEVTYLPTPPEPLEVGPNVPTPGPNNIWASGSWVWQESQYDWQPGYWVAQQPDWVWSPAHYTWTPRGYVYVPGFWDHDIVNRGVMFAPVYYDQPVYMRSGYSYSPNTVIDLAVVLAGLFVQSQSNHYFYGDYYDDRDERRGYQPWYSHHSSQYGDDPIFTHYRSSQLQRDPNWDTYADELFRHRRDHVEARPPQTFALQVNLINGQGPAGANNLIIGRNLADAIKDKILPQVFTPVNVNERKQIEDRGQRVRKLEFERAKLEALPKVAEVTQGATKKVRVVKVKLPASPVAATPIEKLDGAKSPPPMPVAPKPQVAKSKDRHVKPETVEAQATPNAKKQSEKKEARKSSTTEKPKRAKSKAESTKLEPKSSTNGSKPAQTKHESGDVKTKSRTPNAVETPQPQKDAAHSEPASLKPAQADAIATAEDARSDSGGPKVSSQELDSPTASPAQPNSKSHATDSKSNSKSKKDKKNTVK